MTSISASSTMRGGPMRLNGSSPGSAEIRRSRSSIFPSPANAPGASRTMIRNRAPESRTSSGRQPTFRTRPWRSGNRASGRCPTNRPSATSAARSGSPTSSWSLSPTKRSETWNRIGPTPPIAGCSPTTTPGSTATGDTECRRPVPRDGHSGPTGTLPAHRFRTHLLGRRPRGHLQLPDPHRAGLGPPGHPDPGSPQALRPSGPGSLGRLRRTRNRSLSRRRRLRSRTGDGVPRLLPNRLAALLLASALRRIQSRRTLRPAPRAPLRGPRRPALARVVVCLSETRRYVLSLIREMTGYPIDGIAILYNRQPPFLEYESRWWRGSRRSSEWTPGACPKRTPAGWPTRAGSSPVSWRTCRPNWRRPPRNRTRPRPSRHRLAVRLPRGESALRD